MVMFREETRASIKFPAAPESARAIKTTCEGQPISEMEARKGLAENDLGILTPTLGDKLSRGHPYAPVDFGLGRTGHHLLTAIGTVV